MNMNDLDHMLPLRGASHADAIAYSVDVPMRYAECCVKLRDGRTARLRDGSQFVGWAGANGTRRLLFRTAGGRIVLSAEPDGQQRNEDLPIGGVQKFITRDGSLEFVRMED